MEALPLEGLFSAIIPWTTYFQFHWCSRTAHEVAIRCNWNFYLPPQSMNNEVYQGTVVKNNFHTQPKSSRMVLTKNFHGKKVHSEHRYFTYHSYCLATSLQTLKHETGVGQFIILPTGYKSFTDIKHWSNVMAPGLYALVILIHRDSVPPYYSLPHTLEVMWSL